MLKVRRSIYGGKTHEVVCAFLIVVFVGLILCRGIFTSEEVAVQTLQRLGYSNIMITDRAWFFVGVRGCFSNDAARFTATVVIAGKVKEVLVCTEIFRETGAVRVSKTSK